MNEEVLARFGHDLRRDGVRVGTGELADAARALALVDLTDREAVFWALRATLVKGAGSLEAFRLVFDRFFAPPETRRRRQEQERLREEERRRAIQRSAEELTYHEPHPETSYGPEEVRFQLSEEQLLAYAEMPAERRQALQDYIERSFANLGTNPRIQRSVEGVVAGTINYWRRSGKGAGRGVVVEDPRESLLWRDIRTLSEEEFPRMAQLIRRFSARLGTALNRRYRPGRRRWRVDFKGTLRASLSTGGIPYRLRRLSRHGRRPKLLVLCDVSGSMVEYSGFVFQFLCGLAAAVKSLECYLFAEEVERVTPLLREGLSFAATLDRLTAASRQWGAGTDLRRALDLVERAEAAHFLAPDSLCLVVSDGKTVGRPAAVERLGEFARSMRRILWLNPLPREEWGGAAQFARYAALRECRNLAQLEGILRGELLPRRRAA